LLTISSIFGGGLLCEQPSMSHGIIEYGGQGQMNQSQTQYLLQQQMQTQHNSAQKWQDQMQSQAQQLFNDIRNDVYRGSKPEAKKENRMFKSLREYVQQHKDLFYTIGLVLLVDHFIFDGAFKAKVQKIVEKLLDGASKKLHLTKES
jgi:hypothetical protein